MKANNGSEITPVPKLEPCPFCKMNNRLYPEIWSSGEAKYGNMACGYCCARGPKFMYPKFEERVNIEKNLIDRWNDELYPKRRVTEVVTFESGLKITKEEN